MRSKYQKQINISYVNAIEGAKQNSDFQWQGSALEGFICAKLLSLVYEATPVLIFKLGRRIR